MSLIGVRSVSTLPIGTKRPRTESVFGSRFSPDVSAKDTENCLLEQLKLSSVTCTRLRTKFKSRASFHVLVNEEGFPLINNTGVWPSGCLIAPLFGRLSAEQIYPTEDPVLPVASADHQPSAVSESDYGAWRYRFS
jgi:hypothetical protein